MKLNKNKYSVLCRLVIKITTHQTTGSQFTWFLDLLRKWCPLLLACPKWQSNWQKMNIEIIKLSAGFIVDYWKTRMWLFKIEAVTVLSLMTQCFVFVNIILCSCLFWSFVKICHLFVFGSLLPLFLFCQFWACVSACVLSSLLYFEGLRLMSVFSVLCGPLTHLCNQCQPCLPAVSP